MIALGGKELFLFVHTHLLPFLPYLPQLESLQMHNTVQYPTIWREEGEGESLLFCFCGGGKVHIKKLDENISVNTVLQPMEYE